MSGLIKRLKEERIQGSSVVLNYSNFDYWVNWDDIVDIVEDHDQPQLNENQQIVLEWLKERQLEFNERPSTTIYFLTIHYPYGLDDVAKAKKAFSKLNKPEETQVLEVFFRWAQEQEEE